MPVETIVLSAVLALAIALCALFDTLKVAPLIDTPDRAWSEKVPVTLLEIAPVADCWFNKAWPASAYPYIPDQS